MNRRIWSTEDETAIVLEIIRGDESMAAICTYHGVRASPAYRWQEQLLAGGPAALVDRRGREGAIIEPIATIKADKRLDLKAKRALISLIEEL